MSTSLASHYLRWNTAIFQHYYPIYLDDRPTPSNVFFSVDDEAISTIGREIGIEHDPVDDFIHTIRAMSLLNSIHRSKFEWFVTTQRTWLDDIDTFELPPYTGLLAMTVLAASRMSSTGGYSSSNYYTRLKELLDVNHITENDKIKLDSFWESLHEFLYYEGNNQSTIKTHPHFVHIGYPLSQIFLRRADIQRFPDFFVWAKLTNEVLIDDHLLISRFIDWAHLTSCHLNHHFYEFIDNSEFSEWSQQSLVTVLRNEYQKWSAGDQERIPTRTGGNRTPSAGRVKSMDVWFEEYMGDYEFRLVLEYTGNAPSDLDAAFCIEGWDFVNSIEVNRNTHRVVIPIWADKLEVAFTCGVNANLGGDHYRFTPGEVVVFGPSDWSGLASQSTIGFVDEHAILCTTQVMPIVDTYLQQYAEPSWSRTQLGRDLYFYQGVRVPYQAIEEPADVKLACLVPKLRARVHLEGGIRLSRSSWMHGFEPNVVIEAPPNYVLDVLVDGTILQTVHEPQAKISLRGQGLGVGPHTLMLGTRSIKFQLESMEQVKCDTPSKVGGFLIIKDHILYRSTLDANLHPGQMIVQGARVRNDHPNGVRLIPNTRRYVILGEHPGEVYEYDPPYRVAEPIYIETPFRAQWLITVGRHNRRYLHLVGQDCIDAKKNTLKRAKGLREWRYWIKRRYENLHRPGARFRYKGLWDAYCQLA